MEIAKVETNRGDATMSSPGSLRWVSSGFAPHLLKTNRQARAYSVATASPATSQSDLLRFIVEPSERRGSPCDPCPPSPPRRARGAARRERRPHQQRASRRRSRRGREPSRQLVR